MPYHLENLAEIVLSYFSIIKPLHGHDYHTVNTCLAFFIDKMFEDNARVRLDKIDVSKVDIKIVEGYYKVVGPNNGYVWVEVTIGGVEYIVDVAYQAFAANIPLERHQRVIIGKKTELPNYISQVPPGSQNAIEIYNVQGKKDSLKLTNALYGEGISSSLISLFSQLGFQESDITSRVQLLDTFDEFWKYIKTKYSTDRHVRNMSQSSIIDVANMIKNME